MKRELFFKRLDNCFVKLKIVLPIEVFENEKGAGIRNGKINFTRDF